MRILQLTREGTPLSQKDIEVFENDIEAKLPRDYRLFLLRNNGGVPRTQLKYSGKNQTFRVGVFYDLLPSPESGLRRAVNDLEKLVKGYLPIADEMGEQEICISLINGKRGVYLTEYINGSDDPVAVTMHKLEDSFTDFLCSLVEIIRPHDDIQELGKIGDAKDLEEFLSLGRLIDEESMYGFTILCEAIKSDNMPMIQACIERGASLSHTIHTAVFSRKVHLIEPLVEAGADVNEPSKNGQMPLRAVGGVKLPGEEGARNREMRDILLKHGAVKN